MTQLRVDLPDHLHTALRVRAAKAKRTLADQLAADLDRIEAETHAVVACTADKGWRDIPSLGKVCNACNTPKARHP